MMSAHIGLCHAPFVFGQDCDDPFVSEFALAHCLSPLRQCLHPNAGSNGSQVKMYDKEILCAIAGWQKGWREDQNKRQALTDSISRVASKIPKRARVLPSRCYRVIFLDKSLIATLFLNAKLVETISSWTTDKKFAEKFKGPHQEGRIGFIFGHTPKESEVVVNIPEMWKDEHFLEALEKHKQQDEEFCDVLCHYRGAHDQSEVILNTKKLLVSEIVGLTGRGDFDHLCQLAGANSEEEKDELWKQIADDGLYPEEYRWISEEGVNRVLERLIDRLESLLTQLDHK